MTRHHATPDGDVPYTAEEEATATAIDAAILAANNAPPTEEEYTIAVQSMLDEKAQAHHYDNIISACSYAGAPNQFQEEGARFIAWRGDVWTACYEQLALVQNGAQQPTIAEILDLMPNFPGD